MSAPIVVVGSVNADFVLQVDRLPQPGETLGASSMELFPGGKGANQAAAAAKLGYSTYFIGQVGTDPNANMLRESLTGCGVDITQLKEVPGPTGSAIILLQSSGENSIVIVGGANQHNWNLSEDAIKLLQSAGGVLLQREIPEDVNLKVAQIAATAGVPVCLDVGGVDAPLNPEILPFLSVLSPNETELNRITGMPTESLEQVQAAAEHLIKQGVKSVLVKLGSDGSLLLPGAGHAPVRQLVVKADQVVDTTGAGDCFTAAYNVAVLRGLAAQDALCYASCSASICVSRKGAMPSLPSQAEADKLYAAQ